MLILHTAFSKALLFFINNPLFLFTRTLICIIIDLSGSQAAKYPEMRKSYGLHL